MVVDNNALTTEVYKLKYCKGYYLQIEEDKRTEQLTSALIEQTELPIDLINLCQSYTHGLLDSCLAGVLTDYTQLTSELIGICRSYVSDK